MNQLNQIAMTGTVKIVLFRSKTLKNGEHPVMLRVTKGKKQNYMSLKMSCPVKLWDDKTGRPRKSHPLYGQLVSWLDEQEKKARKSLLAQYESSRDYSVTEVLETVNKTETGGTTLTEFARQVIERLETAGRIGYAGIFRDTRNKLLLFTGKDTLEFPHITSKFLANWEAWMQGQGWKKTTISVYFRTLRALIGYARKEQLVARTFNPFGSDGGFTLKGYHKVETPKRSITLQDVQKLAAVPTKPGTNEYHAQQLFLFTYYCRGINFIDVANLTRKNVITGSDGKTRLRYKRRKTGHLFDMILLAPALEIWNHYVAVQTPENLYVWPILDSAVHKQPKQIDWRITRINREWNKALRTVAGEAGLSEYLTLYVARHTFASAMKESGVAMGVISEMMGHDSEETTRIYLRQFPQQTLDDAAAVLLPKNVD